MKYCAKCGAELMDEAVICVKCGCPVGGAQGYTFVAEQASGGAPYAEPQAPVAAPSGTKTAAKVFLIIATVLAALMGCGIPLAWCLPITISYCGRVNRGERVGTGFKVCALLFVSVIAGILMLCDDD